MDKIQEIIPKLLLETADKYVQAEAKLSRDRNERFRSRLARIIRRALNSYILFGVCIFVVSVTFLLLRGNKDEQ